MKKIFCIILIMLTCSILFANKCSWQWVNKMGVFVGKVTIASVPADNNTMQTSFGWDGFIYRIVTDCNAVDADGDLTISDISEANYVSLANFASGGNINVATTINAYDANDKAMGVPVAGQQLVTVTDGNSAYPMDIWIYCRK